jgi:hypothetical protein
MTVSAIPLAASISERWPSWKNPMVGISANLPFLRRRASAKVVTASVMNRGAWFPL